MEVLLFFMILTCALFMGVCLGILWEHHKEKKILQEIESREYDRYIAREQYTRRPSFKVIKGGKE